jgi:hypothetical protein
MGIFAIMAQAAGLADSATALANRLRALSLKNICRIGKQGRQRRRQLYFFSINWR